MGLLEAFQECTGVGEGLSPFRIHRVKYCVWVLGQGRGQVRMRDHRAPGWEVALQVGLDLSPSQPAEV